VLVAAAWPRVARASFCIVDGLYAEISPAAGAPVPRNAHIRVRLRLSPASERGAPQAAARLRGPQWSQHIDDVQVALRRKDARAGGADVACRRRVIGMEKERIIELVPVQPLDPEQSFHIVITTPARPGKIGGRGASARQNTSRFVSEFTTGGSLDQQPPTWAGITSAQIARRRFFVVHQGNKTIRAMDSGRNDPWLVVNAPQARDDASPGAQLAYAIWIAGPQGRVDYTRPPVSFLAWRDGRILAGRDEAFSDSDMCDIPSFPFPDVSKPLRIGIRAIDPAGNASAPSETVLSPSP
jgi:hypothetical protein